MHTPAIARQAQFGAPALRSTTRRLLSAPPSYCWWLPLASLVVVRQDPRAGRVQMWVVEGHRPVSMNNVHARPATISGKPQQPLIASHQRHRATPSTTPSNPPSNRSMQPPTTSASVQEFPGTSRTPAAVRHMFENRPMSNVGHRWRLPYGIKWHLVVERIANM